MLAQESVESSIRPVDAARGKSRYVPSLYHVAAFGVLAGILIIALAPRVDTDFWWHLRDGSYIVSRHIVPSHDFMSYTFNGHSWTDHEWLAEILLYGLYRLAGLWGPLVFFGFLVCATFSLVYANMVQRGTNRVLALFVLAVAFLASTASLGPRIQMLTLFFLAAWMLALYRFEQTRDRRLLIVFPFLMVLWTNVHGGFVLGLVALGITIAGEGVNRWRRAENSFSQSDLRILSYTLIASVAVTIVNRNGIRQLLYPFTFVLPNAYTNLIQESASPNFHMPVMMAFEAMLLILIGAFYAGRSEINWTHLLLIVAFTHLALSQVRNVPLWCVVTSPLLALYLQQLLPASSSRNRPMKESLKSAINVILLVAIVIGYSAEALHFINAENLRQVEAQEFPVKAISYLDTHRLPPHVFVSYSWGGYLLWHLYPRYRVYMDSRADTLYDRRILNAYIDMYAAHSNWRSQLHRMGVQTVLVERSSPLASVLAQEPSWHRAFRDSLSVIYYH